MMANSKVILSNKSKLLYSMFGLLMLALVASAAVAYFQERNSLMASVMKSQLVRASAATDKLTLWLHHNLRIVNTMAETIAESEEPVRNNPTYQFYLSQTARSNAFEYFYLALESDGFFWSYNWPVPEGYDPRTRPWYKASKLHAKPFITWPYQDFSSEEIYVALTAPIVKNEQFIGVVASDISVGRIAKVLAGIEQSIDGKAFLARSDGQILISPSEELKGKYLYQVLNIGDIQVPRWQEIAPDQVLESSDYIYSAAKIDNSDWLLVFAIPQSRITSEVIQETAKLLSYFLIIIFITLVLLYASNRRLLTPMMNLLERDEGTGLANKTKFKERVEGAYIHSGYPGALLLINIDGFSRHSATYSPAVINALRSQIRDRIREVLRLDAEIGLLSESRFVAYMPIKDGDSNACQGRLNSLMERLSQYYIIDRQELNCSFHFGISHYPEHGATIDELIDKAHSVISSMGLRQRGGITIYQPDMSLKLSHEMQMENAIRNALRREEFSLAYQPQYCIKSKDFPCVEALLRWHSSEFNRDVSPGEFIPVAESSDLIVEMGDFVINAAFKQIREWRRQGLEFDRVGINLSPKQLQEELFFDKLMAAVDLHDVSPSSIELEVTETSVLDSPDKVIQTLSDLKSLGFSIAVDDFGTGYSSLQYLKNLPISTLKVDRIFIKDLHGNSQDRAIVSMIRDLAKALNLQVLAEGVETKEQAELLRQWGYQMIQGFYYAKPMTPLKLEEFLERQNLKSVEV